MNNLTAVLHAGYTSIKDPRSQGVISGGGTKKAVTGFSKQSRLRLMKLIRSLSAPPDFHITLTYPNLFPGHHADEWKRHLDNFRRAVIRICPEFWAIWKLEPQKRGAPHFHLMCSLGSEIREKMKKVDVYKLLRGIWYSVVGSGDFKHFYNGVQVEDLRGDGQAKRAMYITSYVFKVQNGEDFPAWERPGRFWGVLNREKMPPCEWEAVNLDLSQSVWLKRLVKRWLRRQSRQYSRRLDNMHSYSIFCNPELMRKIFYWILGPFQLESWRSDQEFGDVYFYDPVNGYQCDCAAF